MISRSASFLPVISILRDSAYQQTRGNPSSLLHVLTAPASSRNGHRPRIPRYCGVFRS